MTVKFSPKELFDIMDTMVKDSNGYISTNTFIKRVSELYDCSHMTVRNYIETHPQFFILRWGKVSKRLDSTVKDEIVREDAEFEAWYKLRNKILDECVAFLSTCPKNMNIDTMYVSISSAREELKYGIDLKFRDILFNIHKLYG